MQLAVVPAQPLNVPKMNACSHDDQRRKLVVAVSAIGGLGAAITAVPFVASLLPSQRAKSAGAPVEVDIDKLLPGQMMAVEWRGKPVWIVHRTPEMLAGCFSTSLRPDNLEIPPHRYLTATRLDIGDDTQA
jgi:Rieske Fe-S protein